MPHSSVSGGGWSPFYKSLKHAFHRSRRFWVIITAAVLLVSAGLTVLLIAKASADSVAEKSTEEVKAYLETVTVKVNSLSSPRQIVTELDKISVPSFEIVPLGEISQKYVVAKAFHKDVTERVAAFTKTIDGYAQLQAFHEKYDALMTELSNLGAIDASPNKSNDSTYLENYYTTLKEINILIQKTAAPSDFSDAFTEVGRVYGSMESNWEGIMTAKRIGSDEAYVNLLRQYSNASIQQPRVQVDMTEYLKTIPSKVADEVSKLRAYKEQL